MFHSRKHSSPHVCFYVTVPHHISSQILIKDAHLGNIFSPIRKVSFSFLPCLHVFMYFFFFWFILSSKSCAPYSILTMHCPMLRWFWLLLKHCQHLPCVECAYSATGICPYFIDSRTSLNSTGDNGSPCLKSHFISESIHINLHLQEVQTVNTVFSSTHTFKIKVLIQIGPLT